MKVSKNLSASLDLRKSVNVNWPSTCGLIRSLLFSFAKVSEVTSIYLCVDCEILTFDK